MKPRGKIGGCFELYRRKEFREQWNKKRNRFSLVGVNIRINITNNIISNWGRKQSVCQTKSGRLKCFDARGCGKENEKFKGRI